MRVTMCDETAMNACRLQCVLVCSVGTDFDVCLVYRGTCCKPADPASIKPPKEWKPGYWRISKIPDPACKVRLRLRLRLCVGACALVYVIELQGAWGLQRICVCGRGVMRVTSTLTNTLSSLLPFFCGRHPNSLSQSTSVC